MKKQIHLNEKELNNLIKESVCKVLKQINESVSRERQIAEISFNPYDYCEEDDEIDCLEENNIRSDYMLSFERTLVTEPMVMYYSDGSGYPGSVDSEDFELVRDDSLFSDMSIIKDTCPELYNKIIDEIDNIDEEEMDWRTIDEDGPFDDYDPSDD